MKFVDDDDDDMCGSNGQYDIQPSWTCSTVRYCNTYQVWSSCHWLL